MMLVASRRTWVVSCFYFFSWITQYRITAFSRLGCYYQHPWQVTSNTATSSRRRATFRRRTTFGSAKFASAPSTTDTTSIHVVDSTSQQQSRGLDDLIMSMVQSDELPPRQETVSFSHVHLYVDHLEALQVYKTLEDQLNQFAEKAKSLTSGSERESSLQAKQQLWKSIVGSQEQQPAPAFVSHGRDVVKQLLAGFGFRITAAAGYDDDTATSVTQSRTVLVTSPDPQGVQFLATALTNPDGAADAETNQDTSPSNYYLDAERVRQFYASHANRPGIAVLGFVAEQVDSIYQRYNKHHPQLVAHYQPPDDQQNDGGGILEVYAYYTPEHKADPGTILRFVSSKASSGGGGSSTNSISSLPLPGLVSVPATFGATSTTQAAYCDHWVSNVWSRTEFLDTLHDTLGFVPKVDFNAGVVAAGEAQIESTVTGNDSKLRTDDPRVALKDQSQVYLPINNALSEVGHVHGFLQELGQGIQHLASRVNNLVAFVQNANEARQIYNEGFTFLRIPRSYYGILTATQLTEPRQTNNDGSSPALSSECAEAVLAALRNAGVVFPDGAVDLDKTREEIDLILESSLDQKDKLEYQNAKDHVLENIARSRYRNLYSLLRDHLSEHTYLRIVRNQILVDIQGEDLLFQIFTSNMLQRQPGDEAPFLEFIQRVCSECLYDETGCPQKVRPGCGGFGIRNFLTLFLSIEATKAMQDVIDAQASGDADQEKYAQAMVQYFTEQLSESNPILTEISDAMTEEGRCKEQLQLALQHGNVEEAANWKAQMEAASQWKQRGNDKLMECSARYNNLMKTLREGRLQSKK